MTLIHFRRLIPISILLLAFALRLFALNLRPVWYDEAFSVLLSERDLPAILSGTAADTMPPLYYVLLHYWLPWVGTTPLGMRMLSVIISMLGVALIYTIGLRGWNARAGRWAAFFCALAPFQIYYGQELRMYGVLALAGLLYLYGVMRLGRSRLIIGLVGVATALALYAHNLAFLTLMAANVFFAWRRQWNKELRLLIGQGLGALLFIPWLVYVPGQLAKIQHAFWTQPPGLVDVLQMILMFTAYLPLPSLFIGIALFLSLSVLAMACVSLVRIFRLRNAPAVGLWLFFACFPPLLMFVVSYLVQPVFVARGVITSATAYYLLLGLLAAETTPIGRRVVLGAACFIAVITLPFYYTSWNEWRRAPFSEADQYLRAQAQDGDLILHDNKLSFFPMHMLDRSLKQEFLADPSGSSNDTLARGSEEAMSLYPVEFTSALKGHDRVWFIIFQTALDQAAEDGHPHGNLSKLASAMHQASVTQLGDLRVFLYENY